jgi:hypothetical protein
MKHAAGALVPPFRVMDVITAANARAATLPAARRASCGSRSASPAPACRRGRPAPSPPR